jgi:hypothetical protein
LPGEKMKVKEWCEEGITRRIWLINSLSWLWWILSWVGTSVKTYQVLLKNVRFNNYQLHISEAILKSFKVNSFSKPVLQIQSWNSRYGNAFFQVLYMWPSQQSHMSLNDRMFQKCIIGQFCHCANFEEVYSH